MLGVLLGWHAGFAYIDCAWSHPEWRGRDYDGFWGMGVTVHFALAGGALGILGAILIEHRKR